MVDFYCIEGYKIQNIANGFAWFSCCTGYLYISKGRTQSMGWFCGCMDSIYDFIYIATHGEKGGFFKSYLVIKVFSQKTRIKKDSIWGCP